MARFDNEINKDHTFVANLYVKHMAHEHSADWTYDTENHWKSCFCGNKSELAAHEFTDWSMVVDNSGTMQRTCGCGYVHEVEISSAMPAFRDATVSMHSSFAINFYVRSDSFVTGAYKDPYVVFEMLGDQTTVTEYTSKSDNYVFTFDDLAPDLMGETVKATLYATAKNGSKFAVTTQYSVAEYCYTALRAEDTNEELKKNIELNHIQTICQQLS